MKPAVIFSLLVCLVSFGSHAQPGPEPPRQLGPPPAVRPPSQPADSARAAAQRLSREQLLAVRYRVGLKTGQVLGATQVSSRYPLFRPDYLVLDGIRQLALAEVRFYEDETGYYRRARPAGGLRELTYHRTLAGRLNLYERARSPAGEVLQLLRWGRPSSFTPPAFREPAPGPSHFAKDEGPLQAFTPRRLAEATREQAGVQALLARARRQRTYADVSSVAAPVMLSAGSVLVLGALLVGLGGGGGGGGVGVGKVGLGLMVGSLPVVALRIQARNGERQASQQAVALYNQLAAQR